MIEAVSWLGRGALAARQLDRADSYAAEARKLALEQLKQRKLDAEPHLPLALGSSIEVQAQVMAGRGERGEAVAFLRRDFEDLLVDFNSGAHSKEHSPSEPGRQARAGSRDKPLAGAQASAARPTARESASAVFLGALVLRLQAAGAGSGPPCRRVRSEGLLIMGPTQHYGYVAGGLDANPQQETA